MERTEPRVIRPADTPAAPAAGTPGMERRPLIDHEDRWVGWVRTDAGLAGGWHHHGNRDSYIYVISGDVTIEYGPGGGAAVHARAGDVIFNPAGMIHREITGPAAPAVFFVVRIGMGPQTVNVERPEPLG